MTSESHRAQLEELDHPTMGFSGILGQLTTLHDSIEDATLRRRSRLLALLTLTFLIVGPLSVIAIVLLRPTILDDPDTIMMLSMVPAALVAYVFNRIGRFKEGAYILIAVVAVVTVANPFLPSGNPRNLVFTLLAVMLGALVISPRASIWIILSTLAGILFLTFFGLAEERRPGFLDMFFILASMQAVFLAFMYQLRSLERIRSDELERANKLLRESEAVLEQRVQERTTELAAAKAEAETANRVKSQFLASVSHELRTPLNGIINFTGFVREGLLGDVNEKQAQALTDVGTNADHLLELINDVLDISKIEAGSLKLFLEDNVDLRPELETILSNASALLEDKPVELVPMISESLPKIRGDRRRIRQIMLNIVSNACKFTEEGSVTVGMENKDDQIHFWVTDTGPGIAPEDHALVFESFKQTETGLRHGNGTGLGMPISRRLAEAHGGNLWLESRPGEGATFHVTLPMNTEI